MNWSWNHGDPYMRGWGLVIMAGVYLVLFSPVIRHYWRRHR